MKLMRKRMMAVLLLAALLTGCGAPAEETTPATTLPVTTAAATEAPTTVPTTEPTTVPTETQPQEERFVLTFAGDCTFGSNPVNRYALSSFENTIGDNWAYPFANVLSYFENDDCTLVNFEGTLTNTNRMLDKAFNFKGPPEYVNILTENSVEAVSLANNHAMDYAQEGYDNTIATLENAGVFYAETNKSTVFTTESGLTIGIYGTVYYSMDDEDMVAEITAMKEAGVDVIIYAPHWGAEDYYKPNNIQVDSGHAAIDAGAHIVWGSHPHVLQPIEEYNDGIIYYSMANFSFGGNIYPPDYDTVLIQQEVVRHPDGMVTLGETTIVPCSVTSEKGHNNFQPTPCPEEDEQYARVMKKLGLSQ